jgi:large subunit ribosomal protein L6
MSRIGKKSIPLPPNVTVTVATEGIVVKGPKGQLVAPLFENIRVSVADGKVSVERTSETMQLRAFHGLTRSLLNAHITGVSEGFSKTLKLIGTGYRVQTKGKGLSIAVGFSHPVDVEAVEGVTFTLKGNDTIVVEGIDKQLVGQVSANIRRIRPPEPYQGKGIKYEDEVIRRKQGKAAA